MGRTTACAVPGELIFVTGNARKSCEVRDILGAHSIRVRTVELDLPPEPQETLEYIATHKLHSATVALGDEAKGVGVLVEDSSLGLLAYGGMPGVFVRWFLEKGPGSLVDMANGVADRAAEEACCFAYGGCACGHMHTFMSKVPGRITTEQRGTNGFGWDSVFEPALAEGKTLAELAPDEKNVHSARSAALDRVAAFIKWASARTPRAIADKDSEDDGHAVATIHCIPFDNT